MSFNLGTRVNNLESRVSAVETNLGPDGLSGYVDTTNPQVIGGEKSFDDLARFYGGMQTGPALKIYSNTTLTNNIFGGLLYCNSSASPYTVTLPLRAVDNGNAYFLVFVQSGSVTFQCDAENGDQFGGDYGNSTGTQVLTTTYNKFYRIQSDGSNKWMIFAQPKIDKDNKLTVDNVTANSVTLGTSSLRPTLS